MRTLTIQRIKSFAGCAMAMKVYIEDPAVCDLNINGVSCRKLGNIKNGKQAEFLIGEEATRVYVVADKLTKNIYNEYYPIPEGNEDIFLSGKVHFNPLAGNPFYFEGITDPDILDNRKKNKKKFLPVMIVAALLGAAAGYLSTTALLSDSYAPEPQTFTSNNMTITLTDEFSKVNYSGFTVCYDSQNVAVFALREFFSDLREYEDYTAAEYAELVVDVNELDSDVTTSDGLSWFAYTAAGDGDEYYYYCVTFKTDTAFWLVQFTCLSEEKAEYQDDFVQWAKSITFG